MKRLFSTTFSLRALWMLMFAASALVIAGCSSDGDEVVTPEPKPEPKPQDNTKVIVDVSTLEVPEGKTADLRFKIVPSTVDISTLLARLL